MSTHPDRLTAALAGRYAIERELGEGGMATVYLAQDLKHSRPVAIKVLRPELAAVIGAERFLKEIETTAGLQHPHILPLFDSGEAAGFLYYVMPYVEGETLRDRLDRLTQLGVDEAVAIAADVADALDYAHRQGVIHRDIKPANILLRDGRPLVADFGIALAVSAAGGGRMTETGLSLGTPWYMSPEQATADRDLTPRSDIYSLGAVLYEMLAGEPPHTGPTGQAVVARILAEDAPPVTRTRKSVPAHVAAAVRKALEKLPADRFESASAFAGALRDPAFRYAAAEARGAGGGRRYARTAAVLGWLAAVVLAGAALWPGGGRVGPTGAPALAFELAAIGPDDATLSISDDGTVLAALGNDIRVRPPSALGFTTLHTDPRRVDGLARSPDGRWIAFSTFGDPEAGLYKIPAAGGDVVTLLEATFADNLVWGEDGWIYFRSTGGVLRIPEDGGAVDTVLATVRRPGDLLDGGRALLLTGNGVWVLDLESGDTVRVAPDGERARWSPTGHVLYTHASGSMFAVPFSLDRLDVAGPAREVLDGVSRSAPQFDLSRTGLLVYQTGAAVPRWGRAAYWWVEAGGRQPRIPIEEVEGHTDGEISPDGRRIAYIRGGRLRVFDLDLGSDRALATANHDPVWSPDGREIAYRDDRRASVWAVPSDGSGEPRRIADLRATSPLQWLPDGTLLIGSFLGDIRTVDARPGAGAEPRDLLVARWQERSASISPDLRWIAYWSDEDGVPRGYVRRWPDLASRTMVTGADTVLERSEVLHWTPDSRRLLYVRSDGGVVSVTLDGDDGARVADRAEVMSLGASGPQGFDGERDRFLVTRSAVGAADPDALPEPNRIVLVTSWLEALARRTEAGR